MMLDDFKQELPYMICNSRHHMPMLEEIPF
jgi:hypothetical protein